MKVSELSPPRRIPESRTVRIESPTVDDGVECWRLARDSKVLDVNSRYAYLLWCRDFAETTVVARAGRKVLGFITGYRRPEEPSTLLVWQVAVDAAARGQGLAGRMLNALFDRVPEVDHLETTITPDNDASIALFTKFARRRGAPVQVDELFSGELLAPDEHDDHEPENKYRIGPIPTAGRQA
jgi:L-2,4-diaminobutyric acid acetyltransferase